MVKRTYRTKTPYAKKKYVLENPKINIKIRLSALWTSLIAFYIYGDYFELYVPGKVENLINISAKLESPTLLLIAAILIAIPALMIVLSILLRPKVNRILNISFGILLTLIVVLVGSTSISAWYSFYVLYAFIEAGITITIVWTAWNWPASLDSR